MKVRNPSEANGPNGYPKDNAAFRRAADAVIERARPLAEKAQAYRERMREDFRARAEQNPQTMESAVRKAIEALETANERLDAVADPDILTERAHENVQEALQELREALR